MFVVLPVNIALDEAPNRLITFYQSTVVVFVAYISYWLLIKEPASPLDFLIKVKDSRLQKKKWNNLNEEEKKWAKKTTEEKEGQIAELLEKIILKHSGSSQELTAINQQ